jgi:serine O-acetyltransferase
MNILRFIDAVFHVPLLLLYLFSSKKPLIRGDVKHWSMRHCRSGSFLYLLAALLPQRPFRSVYYHRLNCGRLFEKLLWRLAALFYPGESTLLIYTTDIGPGLFVQHGLATIIAARKIGANCMVHQQVTLGYTNHTDAPVIGDDVYIGCGAKVLGDVVVGDRVNIGANAVVIANVPSDSTAVGVPARILPRRRIGGLS